jgi:biotin operon repressor
VYRGINEKIIDLDRKVATKRDIEDVKELIHDDLDKGSQVIQGIDNLSLDILALRAEKETLDHTIEMSAREIEEKRKRLNTVKSQIERMECDDKIIQALKLGGMSTIELAEKLGFTRQYVWERLKELSNSGAVKSIKKGRQTKYTLVN